MLPRCRGQIAPFALIGIALLLFFIGTQGEQLRTAIEKMKQQRVCDGLALQVANEQARALNAVAAYNKGITIALNRAYIVGVSAVAVFLCAAYGVPACLKAAPTMALEARNFFRNLESLGRALERRQDQVVEWAAQAPRRVISLFNTARLSSTAMRGFPAGEGLSWAALFPLESDGSPKRNTARPQIHRVASEGYEAEGLLEGVSEFLEEGDLVRCKERGPLYPNYYSAARAYESGRFRALAARGDSLTFYYRRYGSVRAFDLAESPTLPRRIQRNGVEWTYAYVQLRKCQSLLDVVALPHLTSLPRPYRLDGVDHRFAIALVQTAVESPFRDFLRVGVERAGRRPDLWTLSEAMVEGENLDGMKFHPRLAIVTRGKDLWGRLPDQVPMVYFGREAIVSAPEFDFELSRLEGLQELLPDISSVPNFEFSSLLVHPPPWEEIDGKLVH